MLRRSGRLIRSLHILPEHLRVLFVLSSQVLLYLGICSSKKESEHTLIVEHDFGRVSPLAGRR